MTKSPRKNVPDVGIELGAPCMPSELASNRATAPDHSVFFFVVLKCHTFYMGHIKRIWYLSPMQAAKVQASLRIRTVSPEPPLLAHTSSESRGTFRQKARSLGLRNGWACAVKICHDGMLEDTNSLDASHIIAYFWIFFYMYLPSNSFVKKKFCSAGDSYSRGKTKTSKTTRTTDTIQNTETFTHKLIQLYQLNCTET